jgi:hypothetical protein
MWFPKEDPRRIDGNKDGNYINDSEVFNAIHYEKCWHKKLALYRLLRAMNAEQCFSDKWLAVPGNVHHHAVDFEFWFPHDELGCPSEFVETIVYKRRIEIVRAIDWRNSENHPLWNGNTMPYPSHLSLKLYSRDDFLHNKNNTNMSISRSFSYVPVFPERMLIVWYNKDGSEKSREIRITDKGSQKC